MNKYLILLLLLFPLVNASIGYDDIDYGVHYLPPEAPINYSLIPTVNSSDYWDDRDTPADITYDEISGGDVNALGYTGTFNFLAGVVGMLSMDGDPWYLGGTSFEIAENLEVDGDTYLSDTFPRTTLTYSLGSGALRWLNLFVQNINAEEIDAFNLHLSENLTVDGYINGENISEMGLNSLHLNQDNWYNDSNGWISWDGDSNEFNESKLATTYYNASTIQVVTGTPEGDIDDLRTDNNVPYNLSEVASDLELRINFTDVEDFTTLIIDYRSEEEDEPHLLRVQIWDYEDSAWEDHDRLVAVGTYVSRQFGIYDSSRHIEDGIVQIRLYQDEGVPAKTHKHNFDWIVLTKGFGTPVGEEDDPFFNEWLQNATLKSNLNGDDYNITIDNLDVEETLSVGESVGLGTAPVSTTALKIYKATSNQALKGMDMKLLYSIISGNTVVTGNSFDVQIEGANALGMLSVTGFKSLIGSSFGTGQTGNIGSASGIDTRLYFLGNGATGFNIDRGIGIFIGDLFGTAGVTFTDKYGILINSVSGGSGENYAIKTQGGDVGIIADNSKLIMGAGSDYKQFWDGTNEVFNTSGGLAWFSGNLSAVSFNERTSVFDKERGSALDYIKDSDDYLTDGKIDHSKFYGGISYNVTDFDRPVNESYEVEYCYIEEGFFKWDEKEICLNETKYRIIYPYKKLEEGVGLGKEIDVLRQAVYELKLEIAEMRK